MMMINFETQSKQLTLLQEYISALERETQARQIQSQEMQRAIDQSLQNERSTYEAFTRVQKQNDFLRYVLSQLNHQHWDFKGLKMDFEKLHETMGREHFEKMELYSQIKDVSDNHSIAKKQIKELSQDNQRITLMLKLERQRWRQQKILQQDKEHQQNMIIASKIEKIDHLGLKIMELQHLNENLQSQIKHIQSKKWILEQSNQELSSKVYKLSTQLKAKADSYEKIINKKRSEIQKDRNEIEQLMKELKEKNQQNHSLKEDLNSAKQRLMLADFQMTSLNEQNRKRDQQFPIITEKSQNIAKLERKYQQTIQRLEDCEQTIRQLQKDHISHIQDIQSKNHESIRANNIQLAQLQEANRLLKTQIQDQQRKAKQTLKESFKIQQELKTKIAEQEADFESKQQRIRDFKITLELQKLYSQKNSSETQVSEDIQQLQSQIFSQKATIDSLTICLNQKQKEIQILEQSNGSLRRLMMTAIVNEQKALQELQKIKRNNSNCSSKLQIRTRIHYDSTESLRESIVLEKGMRASKSYANIEKAPKIPFKKRATPSQYQFTENGQSVRQVSR